MGDRLAVRAIGRISHAPWGMVVFFVLGAAAGIRNVMRAAKEINAEMARKDVEK